MKEVVKLMDYRPDIKIVDATLRDGGLVNNFRFTDEFVKDLYQTNIKAGVDVMEFGSKADKEMFDVKDFGNIMPGHGGVLDRFDSVLFVAPFLYIVFNFLNHTM